jgi:hypothetical protein
MASAPVIKPDGRPFPRITASRDALLAGTHPVVKSGRILAAALGYITPTRRSRGYRTPQEVMDEFLNGQEAA